MLCNNYNFILVFCIFACSPLLCHEGWSAAGTRWGNIECGSCHMRVKSYFVLDTRIADHLIGDVNYKNQHALISTTSSSEPMNDTSAPMTISLRLLYEILATIVEQYINAPLPIHISVRKHLPKFIRKQYPGMSRRKWNSAIHHCPKQNSSSITTDSIWNHSQRHTAWDSCHSYTHHRQ